jgi:hypothetical protein
MSKLHSYSMLAAIGLASVVFAQTPTTQGRPPNPTPATSPDETSAEPGRTPTQGASETATDPRPATNPAEGTAADRTPPGGTQTTQGTQGRAVMGEDSKLVGAKVVTPADAPLGSVVDVVFDAKGQPSFVVIQSQGDNAAVPFSAASSMMKGDKVVMDQWRLERAPKVKQGEWRSQASGAWKNDASKYLEKG